MLFPWKKCYDNSRQCIKKQRHSFTNTGPYNQDMVILRVMYECGSWTIKKAKCWRIDAFELWCWRRLLRIPQTARRSNQSLLKEINPEYSLEGLVLKWSSSSLTISCEEPTHRKRHWCWERLKEKWITEDKMVGWHYRLNGHEFE